jgi:hypothetical protein
MLSALLVKKQNLRVGLRIKRIAGWKQLVRLLMQPRTFPKLPIPDWRIHCRESERIQETSLLRWRRQFLRFIPALFDDEYDNDDPRRQLACLPVRHARLAMPDPTIADKSNYMASTLINGRLFNTLIGVTRFQLADHVATIREVKIKLQACKMTWNDSDLESIFSKLSCDEYRTILRGKETGQWLMVLPSAINGTKLLAQEY